MDQIPAPIPSLGIPGPDTREESAAKKKQLLATFCSALLPGSGHWLVGSGRKSIVLLILFLILVVGFWPLRLLRFYAGFAILYCAWIALSLYSVLSAQLTRSVPVGNRPSRLWLMSFLGQAVTRASGLRSFSIPSVSMEKTIQRGDRLFGDTYYYRSRFPARKDVVVFKTGEICFIKRVVAIRGATISGKNGDVIINRQLYSSPMSFRSIRAHWNSFGGESMYTFGRVTVPQGKLLRHGDGRDVSLDGRSEDVGLIDKSAIVGKALFVCGSDGQGKIIH